MRANTWALLIAAPSLVLLNTPAGATTGLQNPSQANASSGPQWISLNVELAGADVSDPATDMELKEAGVEMIPSENLKKAKPMVMEPSSEKAMPKKPMAMPVKDEPEPAPMIKDDEEAAPQMQMSEEISGPYVRIDMGYSFNMDSDGTQSAGNLGSEAVDNVILAGGGIGYRFSENIRGDLIFDYRPDADVSATTSAGNTTASEVSALSVMLNAYWDITTTDDLTPYLGAGIGYARLSTSDQTTTGGIATETGATSDNFAWSVTAGAAYKLLDNTLLDMNYRFINMGEFKQATNTTYDDLMAHEMRAGLRFTF